MTTFAVSCRLIPDDYNAPVDKLAAINRLKAVTVIIGVKELRRAQRDRMILDAIQECRETYAEFTPYSIGYAVTEPQACL